MAFKRLVPTQLGELLLSRGLITAEQLSEALRAQKQGGGLIGQVLVRLGVVKEEEIALALTTQFGFPFLPLDSYEIDPEVVRLIPRHVAQQYSLIAIDRIGNALTVAMSNPLNTQAIEDVELVTQCKVQVFVTTMTDVARAIARAYPADAAGAPPVAKTA